MTFRLLLWSLMLLLTGSHFRSRDAQIENLDADWLVIVQIVLALLAIAVGTKSLRSHNRFGKSVKLLLSFLVVAALSALFSAFAVKVIGYWLLLAGVVLLTARIVREAESEATLHKLETVWLATTVIFVFKDALIDFLMQDFQNSAEAARLGMGLIHANHLGFYAALAFWVSFSNHSKKLVVLRWVVRILLLLVIFLTRSRTSLVCLITGGLIRLWLESPKRGLRQGFLLRVSGLSLFCAAALVAAMALFLELDWAMSILSVFNRGENPDSLATLSSARIYIWQNACYRIFENPPAFLFGHGYAVSRSVLNDSSVPLQFFAAHAHNDFLEVFVNMGLLGAVCYFFFMLYNTAWLSSFRRLRSRFSREFALRAATVVVMFYLFSLTEVSIGSKVSPPLMLFLIYLLALDRHFCQDHPAVSELASSVAHSSTDIFNDRTTVQI